MNKFYYDFHIHTALSPCGDNDMTPNNIVNMARLSGLDIIAVTDHNSAGNCRAVKQVVDKSNLEENQKLLLLYGIELETSEAIHVLMLFPEIDAAEKCWKIIENRSMKIKNRIKVYGNQQYVNSSDEVVGEEENLLVISSDISIDEVPKLALDLGGVAVPAHVDKPSNAIIAILGGVTPDMGFPTLEVSPRCSEVVISQLKHDGYQILHDSDSHFLETINEHNLNFLELEQLDYFNVILALRNIKNY